MSNLPQENQNQSSSEKSFADVFADERIEWMEKLKDTSARFRKIEDMAEVQVILYSDRQIALEYMFKLMSIHTKLKKVMLEAWKKAYDNLENADIRYNDKERMKMADNAISAVKYKTDTVSNHIEYFRETIKTIDNMIFGVKHRIDIENYKAGLK